MGHQNPPDGCFPLLLDRALRELVFDDEPLDAILYGGPSVPPTPLDVVGLLALDMELPDEVIPALASVLSSHPEELGALKRTLAAKGLTERILTILLQRIRDNPTDSAELLLRLSRCLTDLGQEAAAFELRLLARRITLKREESSYEELVRASPQDPRVLNEFALFLKNQRHDYGMAEKYYRRALALAPADAVYLNNLAVLLMSVGRFKEAEPYLRDSIEQDPADANALSNLATLLHHLNCDQEAGALFSKAVEVNPNDASVRANFAAFLVSKQQWAEAAVHLDRGWDSQRFGHDKMSARILFLRISICLLEGKDCCPHLGQLKSLFEKGIAHSPWTASAVVGYLQGKVSDDDARFLQSLYDAITDWSGFEALTKIARWADQESLPLDTGSND